MDVMLSSIRGDDWTVLWFLFTRMTSSLRLFLCFCSLGRSSTCIPQAGDELQPSQSGWEGRGAGGISGWMVDQCDFTVLTHPSPPQRKVT